jgi:hypothetical protein
MNSGRLRVGLNEPHRPAEHLRPLSLIAQTCSLDRVWTRLWRRCPAE